jgi:hypothetical protein
LGHTLEVGEAQGPSSAVEPLEGPWAATARVFLFPIGTPIYGVARRGRSHSDALVGSIVWSTTASSSAARVSRSILDNPLGRRFHGQEQVRAQPGSALEAGAAWDRLRPGIWRLGLGQSSPPARTTRGGWRSARSWVSVEGGVRTRALGHRGRAGTDAGPREWVVGPEGPRDPVRGARATQPRPDPGPAGSRRPSTGVPGRPGRQPPIGSVP